MFLMIPPPTRSTLFPYTTLFRSLLITAEGGGASASRTTSARTSTLARVVSGRPGGGPANGAPTTWTRSRSEEHTSELQSRLHLVCRLLLEKKKRDTSVG